MCALPLGDVNGDGVMNQVLGNVVRTRQPSANLLAGSNQALVEGDTSQEIVQTSTYNQFGQPLSSTDPEQNVETYEYYPEQDPNGDSVIDNPAGNPLTGGYLKQTTGDKLSGPGRDSGTDPTPTIIRAVYEYDARGNMTRQAAAASPRSTPTTT